MNREFLKSLGLDDEAIGKIMDENGRDIEREKQKTDQAKADLTAAQKQLADRLNDMEELKKSASDAGGIKQQLADLQEKYTKETEAYKGQLADRDYSDALTRAIADKGIKFSSKSAEKAFLSDLKANRLEMKDGALEGFDAYYDAQVKADPTAFQSDKPAPTFAKPVGAGGPPAAESRGARYAKQFNAQYYTAPTTTKE